MKKAWVLLGGISLGLWVLALSLTYKIQALPVPARILPEGCTGDPFQAGCGPGAATLKEITSAQGYEAIVATFVPEIGLTRFAGIGVFLLVVSALLLGLTGVSFYKFLKSK
jgi:hypothetical protein